MKFYKSILKPKTVLKLDNTCENNNFKFNSSSSCLIKNNNNSGYKLNIRYVNYNIQPNGSYTDCDKNIITINKYVEFDNNFNILDEKWLNTHYDGRQYIGIEDVRIWTSNTNQKFQYYYSQNSSIIF